jgi:choline dehydrogenase-like flavoprotein
MLGGSSALNFMVFHRASKDEYDAWEKLGAGKGWNWEGLLPFFKKSENFHPSMVEQYPGIPYESGVDDSVHGRSGPVQVRYNNWHTDLDEPCLRAFERIGLQVHTEPVCLSNLDRANFTMSSVRWECYGAVRFI